MTHDDYKAERQKHGSQAKVAALLRVRTATISDRETGKQPISREAWFALLWIAHQNTLNKTQNSHPNSGVRCHSDGS